MRCKTLIAFFFALSFQAFSQGGVWLNINSEDAAADFLNLNNWYLRSSYDLNITYKSYDSCAPENVKDFESGFIRKHNQYILQSAFGLTLYQNSEIKLVIDSLDKKILINNAGDHLYVASPLNHYTAILGSAKNVSLKQEGDVKLYRVEFENNFTIRRFELTVSKDTFISQMKIEFGQSVPGYDPGACIPELSININEVPISPTALGELLVIDSIVHKNKKGKYSPSLKYSGYKVIDQRLKL